jgi:DNA-binding NarL/FixJ family response regulator
MHARRVDTDRTSVLDTVPAMGEPELSEEVPIDETPARPPGRRSRLPARSAPVNAAAPERVKILIAHGLPVVAAGLAAALGRQAGFEVVHGDAPEPPGCFDIVVTDHKGALGWMSRVHPPRCPRPAPAARVLLVGNSDGEAEVRAALNAGVHGYLLTDCELHELVDSVAQLSRGGRYLCASVASRVAESLTREALTHRETDVLALMVRGCSNKAIARDLGIAVGTVKAHAKAVFAKLGVRTRSQAVALATERGLVVPALEPASD